MKETLIELEKKHRELTIEIRNIKNNNRKKYAKRSSSKQVLQISWRLFLL